MVYAEKQNDTCETCMHDAICVMKPIFWELRKRRNEMANQIALSYRSSFPVTVRCELYMPRETKVYRQEMTLIQNLKQQ